MKPTRASQRWLCLFHVMLIGIAVLMYLRGSLVPSVSLLAVSLAFALWQAGLYRRDLQNPNAFEVLTNIQRPHYYQIFFQGTVYLYWSLYWDEVRIWAPLIFAQIAFSYGLEALLSWSRGRPWRLGWGPWPIVGSVNLFFWFKEEYFYLQLLLIAATQLTKEFVVWKRDGRTTHIFNPSGIALALTGLGLMLTGATHTANGVDLIVSFDFAPNFFEVLLFVGLAVQFFFSTTLITFGGAVALSIIFFSLKPLGLAASTPFDTSVLIGLTLLATDPQTSPRNRIGKLLFGLCYGACIFTSYAILRNLQQPPFFDKIMGVVAVNLFVPQLDAAGNWIYSRVSRMRRSVQVLGNRFMQMAAYAALFVAILPSLKNRYPAGFVDPFPPQKLKLSSPVLESLAKSIALEMAYPGIRKPFGFWAEFVHFNDYEMLDRDAADAHFRIAVVLYQRLGESELALKRLERAAQKNSQYTPLLNEIKATTNR